MPWQCASCTFANMDARTICEMCGSKRPSVPAQSSAAPSRNNPAPRVAEDPSGPAQPAVAPRVSGPTEADIKRLMAMEFPREQALLALRETGNPEAALDWLIRQSATQLPSQPTANVGRVVQPVQVPPIKQSLQPDVKKLSDQPKKDDTKTAALQATMVIGASLSLR